MMNKNKNDTRQKGSVFIYILMAVVLLGALTYAVSRGNRASTSALTEEQAKLAAQEIIEYGNTVATAVQKLKLRGCMDTELSFENNIFKAVNGNNIDEINHNPNNNTDGCKVFHGSGGNITPKITSALAVSDYPLGAVNPQAGHWSSWEAILNNIGSSENDIFYLNFSISEAVCRKINNILGVSNNTDPIPAATGVANRYDGNFSASNFANEAAFNGKFNFCYGLSSYPGLYGYVHTVLAR